MSFFYVLNNVVQNYAWGSETAITDYFGIANTKGKPQAEIWMGIHPNGCSESVYNGENVSLYDIIIKDPVSMLGKRTMESFGTLPYLFKVLAAEQALSIQVHPNKQQAEIGFKSEQDRGVPISAPFCNYKDSNHKPELVYAISEYQAMNGFRSIDEIIEHFFDLAISELRELVDDLISNQTSSGLSKFFSELLLLEGQQKQAAINALMAKVSVNDTELFKLIAELERQYPNDIGLFSPLILNVITLKPGEAMFLDAETPHAYIKGVALEIMANSDNVLRAGLTSKHIDVEELIKSTRFESLAFERLLLKPTIYGDISEFEVPVSDFKFAIVNPTNKLKIHIDAPEILLALDCEVVLTHNSGDSCIINKGDSVFIPAFVGNYLVTSKGRVARAYC